MKTHRTAGEEPTCFVAWVVHSRHRSHARPQGSAWRWSVCDESGRKKSHPHPLSSDASERQITKESLIKIDYNGYRVKITAITQANI